MIVKIHFGRISRDCPDVHINVYIVYGCILSVWVLHCVQCASILRRVDFQIECEYMLYWPIR